MYFFERRNQSEKCQKPRKCVANCQSSRLQIAETDTEIRFIDRALPIDVHREAPNVPQNTGITQDGTASVVSFSSGTLLFYDIVCGCLWQW